MIRSIIINQKVIHPSYDELPTPLLPNFASPALELSTTRLKEGWMTVMNKTSISLIFSFPVITSSKNTQIRVNLLLYVAYFEEVAENSLQKAVNEDCLALHFYDFEDDAVIVMGPHTFQRNLCLVAVVDDNRWILHLYSPARCCTPYCILGNGQPVWPAKHPKTFF